MHCGIEWLGEVNGVAWKTDGPADAPDHVPPEWASAVNADGMVEVTLLMQVEPEPTITATAAGHTVTYRAVAGDPAGCD